MIFTTNETISTHFLQFAAASFYYTTGYAVSFSYPDRHIEPYQPYTTLLEPYDGYLAKQLGKIEKLFKMNTANIHYMDFNDVIIVYPISHGQKYLGTMLFGPLAIKLLNTKNDFNISKFSELDTLDGTLEKLIRAQLMGNLTDSEEALSEIEANTDKLSSIGDKVSDITTPSYTSYRQSLPLAQQFQIQYLTNLVNLVMNSSFYDPTVISGLPIANEIDPILITQKVSNRIMHHSIDQEEKILKQILISDETFIKLALKHISKLSNLVAPPLADDPVRSEKNRFIVSATIVSREAIKLGMPSELAFTYSDYFINKIESYNTLKEIWDLQMSLFMFFRKEVKKSQTKTYFSHNTSMLLNYIEKHIDTNLSLREICKKLELDYKYASNCFKKDTGLGFNKFLTKRKMEVAKKELETTETPIQTISENLGYTNAYYFTRAFKSTFGVTPSEFRKRSFEETDN